MRFMIIVKGTEPSPPPSSELLAAMGKFNDELIEAGVLLVAEGLQPSSAGAKVRKQAGKVVVQDGPFTEAKELIGGFWIIKADSLQEAIDWVAKVPLDEGNEKSGACPRSRTSCATTSRPKRSTTSKPSGTERKGVSGVGSLSTADLHP